ncbi:cyclase [Humidesulfovibrio mexicanus]|uniref:imidazole glycerol-phosphate synthase n=1 Tax=Humidesulfovibrio mexicanus TaxID=147047 RepID=A0A239BVU7_9BACT|nr:imidazole glycerol phosphate synthase cyclase subunit [Humidesulfovibrio mexicanus]SNS11561.1 cyclase [Humidesulfovibrio mexicanus]
MLKKRVIACLLLTGDGGGLVVQSLGFHRRLPVGRPEIAAEFLDSWGVDEIILLKIDARGPGDTADPELVRRVAGRCFAPLTVGGGIRSVEDAARLVRAGADKIVVNAGALESPALVGDIARVYGSQCVVGAMDVRRLDGDRLRVFTGGAKIPAHLAPEAWATRLEALGAGEILVQAADRDGQGQGYDLDLTRRVAQAVSVPVIALGGAGRPEHLRAVLTETGAAAAAVGNMLHYTEHSVAVCKASLRAHGVDVRLSPSDEHGAAGFDADGRMVKRPDEALSAMRFEHHPKEVI